VQSSFGAVWSMNTVGSISQMNLSSCVAKSEKDENRTRLAIGQGFKLDKVANQTWLEIG
jgi:hypothetical protein